MSNYWPKEGSTMSFSLSEIEQDVFGIDIGADNETHAEAYRSLIDTANEPSGHCQDSFSDYSGANYRALLVGKELGIDRVGYIYQ